MKVLIVLLITATLFTVQMKEWLSSSREMKENTVKMMMQNFKEDNPTCIKAHIVFYDAGEELQIFVECTEEGRML